MEGSQDDSDSEGEGKLDQKGKKERVGQQGGKGAGVKGMIRLLTDRRA